MFVPMVKRRYRGVGSVRAFVRENYWRLWGIKSLSVCLRFTAWFVLVGACLWIVDPHNKIAANIFFGILVWMVGDGFFNRIEDRLVARWIR